MLVITTWNTSAADSKRAIARADAHSSSRHKVCCKTSKRNGQTQSPKNRLKSFVGSWQKVTIWHIQTIALTAELDRRTSSQCCDVRASWAATPYRLRRVSRSARRLSVRQSGSPHRPVGCRRLRALCLVSLLRTRARVHAFRLDSANPADILKSFQRLRRYHPLGLAESHGFRSRSPNPVWHPTSPSHPPMSLRSSPPSWTPTTA